MAEKFRNVFIYLFCEVLVLLVHPVWLPLKMEYKICFSLHSRGKINIKSIKARGLGFLSKILFMKIEGLNVLTNNKDRTPIT